jgi:hypothetical protein
MAPDPHETQDLLQRAAVAFMTARYHAWVQGMSEAPLARVCAEAVDAAEALVAELKNRGHLQEPAEPAPVLGPTLKKWPPLKIKGAPLRREEKALPWSPPWSPDNAEGEPKREDKCNLGPPAATCTRCGDRPGRTCPAQVEDVAGRLFCLETEKVAMTPCNPTCPHRWCEQCASELSPRPTEEPQA